MAIGWLSGHGADVDGSGSDRTWYWHYHVYGGINDAGLVENVFNVLLCDDAGAGSWFAGAHESGYVYIDGRFCYRYPVGLEWPFERYR